MNAQLARAEAHVAPPAAPAAASAFLHRFVRDLVYGANDGIITTFAVVAGVAGARLSPRIVLILGVANLVADGISMGASNYLGIRSERQARHAIGRSAHGAPPESAPIVHGVVTLGAFVAAGAIPLLAYLAPVPAAHRFALACALTLAAQFAVGAARTVVTGQGRWRSGLEMLAIGAAAALLAWAAGRVVGAVTGVAP